MRPSTTLERSVSSSDPCERKDGTELPIEVSLSPLNTAQEVTVSASIRDISERKRAEVAARIKNFTLHTGVLNTHVEDGVVSVYGWAASPIETRALEVVIENTPGVLKLRNCLSRTLPYV